MLKGNTRKLGAVGIASAGVSGLLALFEVWKLALFFLAISLVAITLIALITHRYLVRRLATTPGLSSATNQIAVLTNHLKNLENASSGTAATQSAKAGGKANPDFAPIGNFLGADVYRGGVGPEYEYAERSLQIRGKLETFALRNRSIAMRDVFARAATNLHYNATDIQRILRLLRAGYLPKTSIVKGWRPEQLLALARILANQRLLPSDLEDAETIFNAVKHVFGKTTLKKSDIYIYSEVLGEIGSASAQKEILKLGKVDKRDPIHYSLMKANSINPRESDQGAESWLQIINGLYQREELQPISVDFHAESSALDSISSTGQEMHDGPLVTVIVPTFKGSSLIETTFKSLKNQTWANIEIIVVDDGSGEETVGGLKRLLETYPDIKLIQQPTNLGAYPARNRALDEAQGEFITVHDDDDWSHPQKIQLQVEHLLSNDTCVANMTRHVRVTPDLRFTRINNNPSVSQPNFSSLMLRKSTLDELGRWDEVNRGADAEFRDRLVSSTGKTVEVLRDVPLSFTRTHPDSLTAGEIGRGYIDPSRLFYQRAYQQAHEDALTGGEWAHLSFAKPRNMLPGQRAKHLGDYDVVFATDYAFPGGTSNLTLNEIEAAADRGLKVGMIHMFSPVNTGNVDITERSLAVASRRDVDVLSLTDSVQVSHLVIRHPSVLQFVEGLSSSISASELSIIVNNPPVLEGGKGYGFDLYQVKRNTEKLFGSDAKIYAESGVTHQLTRKLVDKTLLESETWPGFVNLPIQDVRTPDIDRKPIVGRHSRDAALKWPTEISVYRDVYSGNDEFDVHIMGGISTVSSEAQRILMDKSRITDFGGMSVPDYLAGIDFWIYYHDDSLRESFGMAIVEAMAAGIVVILPHYMQPNFGEGAIYAKPSEVRGIIDNLWSDSDAYSEQSARGIKVVQDKYTKEALFSRLGVS